MWEVEPRKDPDQGGFSATGRTNYGNEFPPMNLKIDFIKGQNFSLGSIEFFTQIFDFQLNWSAMKFFKPVRNRRGLVQVGR